MTKRGRPSLSPGDRTTQITFKIAERELDDVCRVAIRDHVSVGEVFRRSVRQKKGQRNFTPKS